MTVFISSAALPVDSVSKRVLSQKTITILIINTYISWCKISHKSSTPITNRNIVTNSISSRQLFEGLIVRSFTRKIYTSTINLFCECLRSLTRTLKIYLTHSYEIENITPIFLTNLHAHKVYFFPYTTSSIFNIRFLSSFFQPKFYGSWYRKLFLKILWKSKRDVTERGKIFFLFKSRFTTRRCRLQL